jgi:hypothetical protein
LKEQPHGRIANKFKYPKSAIPIDCWNKTGKALETSSNDTTKKSDHAHLKELVTLMVKHDAKAKQ